MSNLLWPLCAIKFPAPNSVLIACEILGMRLWYLFQQLCTHHITFLSEHAISSTLWGHPPHRKLHVGVTLLPAVVVSSVDVLSQTKISHFDNSIGINPKSWSMVMNHCRGTLPSNSVICSKDQIKPRIHSCIAWKLYKHLHNYKHTCSSVRQGPCVWLSDQLNTPFLWQFADTFPGELIEHEKSVVHSTMMVVSECT